MKIALACNGEGFGHASRIVTFYESLKNEYEIVIFAPRTVHDFFAGKIPDAEVQEAPHMHLALIGDRLDFLRTIRENLPAILTLRTKIVRMSHALKKSGASVLINDYEPFSAIAAHRIGIPVLQFNHPGIVIFSPSIALDALMVKFGARFMMPAFDKRIFCSFFNGDVGPMIRHELVNAKTSRQDYFLVYLKKEYRRPVLKHLHKMGIHNYQLFPNKQGNHVEALAGCKAVISNAGHQTLSEAIFLKKPVFALPQRGQYEQRLNAQMLAASGWGSHGHIWNFKRTFGRFLADLDSYPGKPSPLVRFNFRNDTARILFRVRRFIRNHTPPRNVLLWTLIFPEDEAQETIHNLWGIFPQKTPEMIAEREKLLYRQFVGQK